MATDQYRSTPDDLSSYPPGIPYIIANEAAERFSFYGMKAALAIFMVNYLSVMGGSDLNEQDATSAVSLFNFSVYLTPLIGAVLADAFFGKYRIIVCLSIVYCLGHLSLAFMGLGGVVELWLLAGLGLIAVGAGGIKPCVSAHVGDQFGKNNQHLLTKIFNLFYLSINAGAIISNLAIPYILKWYGPHWAFGTPGVLMLLATVFFWMGRRKFIHVPPKGRAFFAECFSREGLSAIFKLAPLFLVVAMFWCLFDQTASTLVFQAEKMNLNLLGIEILPSQIQAFNPFLIIVLIPLFTFLIYPTVNRFIPLTPLRKVGAGLFLMTLSFAVISLAQEAIDRGESPHIAWQLVAYLIFTIAEILISIVCLEFSYTQAPNKMKSLVLGLFLASVALGNGFTAIINRTIQIPEKDNAAPTAEHISAALAARNYYKANETFPHQINSPLTYTLLHANAARLSEAGPDGEFKTADDLNTILSINKDSTLDPESWLYQEKMRKGLLDEVRADESPVEIAHAIGGGTTLEGAAYFWFFTKLMLATAVLFIPYALLYREKTYLQD